MAVRITTRHPELAGSLLTLAILFTAPRAGIGQSIPLSPPSRSAASQAQDAAPTESVLRAKLHTQPFDAAAARGLAALLEQTGRVNAAIALRRTILAHAVGAPAIAQATMELATAMVEANQSKQAIPLLQALVAREPLNEPAAFELGTAFAHSEDFKSAASAFAKAAQLKPTDAEAQLSSAKALVTLLLYTEAEPYVDSAVLQKTSPAEVHVLRGMIYSHTGREAQAIPELKAAIAIDPSNADAQLQLGESLLQTQQFQDALSPLQHALAIHSSVPAYFQLAKAYRGLGDTDHANDTIRSLEALRARQVADTKIEMLRNQAERALVDKQYAQAADAYQAAVALRPDDGDLIYHLALAHGQAGQYDLELGLLQQALALAPRSAGALSELGTLEGMRGQPALAEKTLRQALQIDPQRADALNNLAVLVAQRGDLAEAETLLTNAIESSPTYGSAYRSLGLVYAAQGRTAAAETALRTSTTLDPKDASNELALGQFYMGTNQDTNALIALQAAARLAPTNPEIVSLMNQICTQQNLNQPTRALCAAR